MKVLHIEDRFHPGMGYQINFFARYHKPVYEFSILTSDSSRLWTAHGDNQDLHKVDESFGKENDVSIHRLPAAMDRGSRQNLWLKGLIRAIKKLNPDILYVHTIESYSSIRILLSRKTLSNHVIFFDTHTLLNQFGEGIKFRIYLWFFRNIVSKRIVKYDARVFATVPENRMILEKEYGIPADRILYSPIGTDLSLFKYDPHEGSQLREKERISKDAMVLLYTGKINERKNPHLILEAVSIIEKQVKKSLYIYFVGAKDEDYFERKMKSGFSNINICVKFVPAVPVSELYKWYSMADFAVFPDENTLSALDAQVCRLPVIMQEDLTNAERLTFGGLTYRKGDLKELGERILKLMEDRGLRQKLGSEGEAFIKANYDYRRIVNKMESDLGIED